MKHTCLVLHSTHRHIAKRPLPRHGSRQFGSRAREWRVGVSAQNQAQLIDDSRLEKSVSIRRKATNVPMQGSLTGG
jgi:hypothetical protein